MSRPHLAALFTCFMLVLPLTAHADEPRAYADARAPMPEEEVAALTKKLEALSAKKAWKEADVLATKSLGAQWCADAIALPFRTFAALGVIARRSKKSELALTCTLRSFFAADTRTTHGQAFFELSLLVDAMSSEEFIAFQKRAYDFPSSGCGNIRQDDRATRRACCYTNTYKFNDFIMVIRSFNEAFTTQIPEYLGVPSPWLAQEERYIIHRPTPKELERLRKLSATRLLQHAYDKNPSPALAKRLTARLSDTSHLSALTTSLLPSRLEPAHVASSHEEARTWLLEHARKRTQGWQSNDWSGQPQTFSKIDASHRKASQDGLSVTQSVIGHVFKGGEESACDYPEYTTHYLIVHMKGSSEHLVFLDPERYKFICSSRDHSGIDSPRFQARSAASAPLFSVSSSTSAYENADCDLEFYESEQVIYCSTDKDKTPRCLVWRGFRSWYGMGGQNYKMGGVSTPSFSFKKGLSDFTTSAHSASMQALIAPVANASFMEVYDAIPGLQEQIHGWFTAP